MSRRHFVGFFVAGIIVALLVSCGRTPIGVIGEWTIVGGSYFSSDQYYINAKYEDRLWGDYEDGEFSISEQQFNMSAELDLTYFDDYYYEQDGLTIIKNGDGYVSVNSKDKYITFIYDSLEIDYYYDTWIGWNHSEEQEQTSRTYGYEISVNTMTLIRDQVREVEGYIDEIEETIELERN